MSLNINNNILSYTGFTSLGYITNAPTVITNGLVLWYDAGNLASYNNSTNYYDCGYGCQYYASNPGCTNCNTQIKDMSGLGNDGTFSGNVYVASNSTGGTGGAMYFDGTSDYVTIGSSSTYNSIINITAEVWCFPMRNASYEYLFSNDRDCCGTYKGFDLNVSNLTPSFQIWNSTNATCSSTSTITLNNHYHIAATYNGTVMNIYVNGNLSGTTNTSLGLGTPASYNLYLGRLGYSDNCYQGYISVARIYNRALNYNEIVQNFNAGRQRYGI